MAPLPPGVAKGATAILGAILTEIVDANEAWELYGATLAGAYKSAYEAQQATLQKVKLKKQEDAKKDAADINLVLTLLTVALAGTVGGALARSVEQMATRAVGVVQHAGKSKITADIVESHGAAVTSTTMGPLKDMGPLKELLDPMTTIQGDIFQPAGDDPLKYYEVMQESIKSNSKHLTDEYKKRAYGGNVPISDEDAAKLYDSVTDEPYIKNQPREYTPPEKTTLTSKMELGLWIAWAYRQYIPH